MEVIVVDCNVLSQYLLEVIALGIATRPRVGRSGFYGSNPGGGWEFFSSPPRPDRFWGPPSILYKGYQGLFP
jgi:hypothetical protein